MARAKLSALLVSLAGRYGGGVFRDWKGVTVLGALPASVRNPNTVAQVKARNALGAVSKNWDNLTAAARGQWAAVGAYLSSQWENYSQEVGSVVVIKTPRGPFGGLAAMSSSHCLLNSCGQWDPGDALIAAPVGHTAPTAPTAVAASGNTAGLIVTATAPSSWGDEEKSGDVRVWVKSENGVFFAQCAGVLAAGTITITTLRAAGSGSAVPLVEGWYYVQCDAVNAGGLRSMPSAVTMIKLGAPA